MNILEPGQKAPEFKTVNQEGKEVSLSDFKNKRVVLYFYPKDDTPGCTAQACGLRDQWQKLSRQNVVLFGVSPDSPKSHTKFIEKYTLPFSLLSDQDHSICEAYGVWVEKSMYGKKYMGVERTTFVIGPDGVIEKIFRKVKPETHASDLLEALKSIA